MCYDNPMEVECCGVRRIWPGPTQIRGIAGLVGLAELRLTWTEVLQLSTGQLRWADLTSQCP